MDRRADQIAASAQGGVTMDPRSPDRPLLSVEALSKRFGGFAAVSELGFELRAGEILGLVGPNGAGKTTVFNLVSGFLRPSAGRIFFEGRNITGRNPQEIARLGLVRSFQLNKLFADLSVEENVRIGCHTVEPGGWRRLLFGASRAEKARFEARVEAIIKRVGLEAVRRKRAKDLAYGDQKLLGIGLALGVGPTLLMLDEPFAGMNQTESQRCADLLRDIARDRITMFLVDHNMRAIMGICDRVLVLNFGAKVADGKPQDIQNHPEVIRCYLGSKHLAAA
jgi:ABC-type branched-subunit amino acid transport system ATPase component